MFKKSYCLLFLCVFINCNFLSAQVKKPRDSAGLYKKIEKYSQRSKFGKLMHKLIFEPTAIKESNPIRKPTAVYKAFEGKIIRNITILSLDPLGNSEMDSTRKARNWAERLANRIHIKTTQATIRNFILLKKNEPLDSLLIKESERLMRTQRYVRRVVIEPKLIKQNPDSVDIYIRVLDSWSLIPKGSLSSSRLSFDLNERNFLGSGHQLGYKNRIRFEDGKKAHDIKYVVPNFKNTFIQTTINYSIALEDNYFKIINIERPFYSPFAKYAGGIYFDQQFRKDSLQDKSLKFSRQNFKYNTQDYWFGRAIRIFNGNSENDRTTNLIITSRYLNTKFLERPTVAYDTISFFSGEHFYLSGIGVASRQFVQDKYLFNFGIPEDVPVGKIYGLTAGYQQKNQRGRLYLGARASFGNYFKWGYLSTNFEYGTFFRDNKTDQTAFSFQANYFTNLITFGKWKLRQFIKPQLVLGSNRLQTLADRLSINENFGIQGFNSPIFGTKKMLITWQTQAYSPWKMIGFRFNPYLNYAAAVLGDDQIGLSKTQVYSKISIGFIISNDYLVFSSFQLSLSYYPNIPGSASGIFKTNSFNTEDFGFQDFELARPRTVNYQ